MSNLYQTFREYQSKIIDGFAETFYMVLVSFIISLVLGTIAGLLLSLCGKNRPYQNKYISGSLSFIINIIKSVPFMLLMIIMVPVSRFLIGTGYGIYASMISLSLIGLSVVSRHVEQSIIDVNQNLYQAGESFGFSRIQTVYHIILVEAKPSLVLGYTSALISLIAYSTVVGVVNGGGIGTLALTDGVGLWRYDLILIIIILMVILIQVIQFTGSIIATLLNKKTRREL